MIFLEILLVLIYWEQRDFELQVILNLVLPLKYSKELIIHINNTTCLFFC